MATPYVGFSGETLSKQACLKIGDTIICPQCGSQHEIDGGEVGGQKSDLLLFYKCGEKMYLAGVDGRLLIGVPSDVAGNI